MSVISELYEKIALVYGSGRPEFCRPIGREAADYGLTFVHKLILMFNTPELLAKKGPDLWSAYYRPSRLQVDENMPGRMSFSIIGLDTSPAHLESIAGWIERVAELVKGYDVRVDLDRLQMSYAVSYRL